MKKIFILIVAVLFATDMFAQRITSVAARSVSVVDLAQHGTSTARTTAVGDTAILHNTQPTDTLTIYTFGTRDSGFVTGTNYWGDKAFAERYVNDSTRNMQVIGVYALFNGIVSATTTKSVTFKVWGQSSEQMLSDTLSYNGFPYNVLDSLSVPLNQIGIGTTGDTIKSHFFPVATGNVTSFFVGYSINYNFNTLAGDTIGLVSTKDGDRTGAKYAYRLNISDFGDTSLVKVLNVQNTTLGSDNIWYDNYTQNDSLFNNLAIYPIVIMGYPTTVKGITRNNLTFFGNYPNPAENNTSIKFSLAAGADVTVLVTDISGRVLSNIRQSGLGAGEHIISVNTSEFPVGEYLYLLRTSAGDGIAGKIIKTNAR